MIRRTTQYFLAIVAVTLCLNSSTLGDILTDGEPNIDDDRLYAWYDGNEAFGLDQIPQTPIWPNKQGNELRDIDTGLNPNGSLTLVPTLNGNTALEYIDVATWVDPGNWGTLVEQFTVFVAATVRERDGAFLFTGNQTGGGTEANANYGAIDPDYWSIKADVRVQTAPLVLDELQYHAFTFTVDGVGLHHLNGELVGEGDVGYASLQGFVLGGRVDGFQRATAEFAEVLVYNEALPDADRQAIESYLDNKFFGAAFPEGDYSKDGELNAPDLDLQAIAITDGNNPPEYDLNDDGSVNFTDRLVWVNELRNTWIGDANLNGEFTSSDMVQVFVPR